MAVGPGGPNPGGGFRFNPMEMIRSLTAGQMVSIGIIVLMGILVIIAAVYYAKTEKKVPLYNTKLDAKTQVQVTEELTARGVTWEISKIGLVLVPESRAEELKTQFEALDIKPEGPGGYEILDNTNPLKAGESMMQLKKMQALEIELERMLEQNPNVTKAKVKIRAAKDSPFADETKPAMASVMLRLRNFSDLNQAQVRGMQQMVASAIEGATTRDVTITDQFYNLLTPQQSDDENIGISNSNIELKSKYERDLEKRVEDMLDQWLGPGRSNAKVSLDMNFDQIETMSKTYGGEDAEGEPQRYSEQLKTERIAVGANTGGAVGAAPNTEQGLAEGAIPTTTAEGAQSTVRDTATRQFMVNELQTKRRAQPFTVTRMSIAIQVDYKLTESETKKPTLLDKLTKTEPDWIEVKEEALTQDELNKVRELVIGATGFVPNRDYIAIQNFPFRPEISKRAQASMDTGLLLEYVKNWTPFILKMLVFALFIMLAISLFRRFVAPILQQAQLEDAAFAGALPSGPPKTVAELESELEAEIESAIPNASLSKAEIMKKRLIEMTQQDADTVAGLVRTWLLEDD